MADNRDSEERRNEFVDAAEKLFRENGIVDTTISAIVKEMDVAKGLFYYYFKSKDDVIDAISEKYNEVFNEMMNASMEEKSDYDSRLHQFVGNTVLSFRDLDSKLSTEGDVDLSALSMRSIDEAKSNAIAALVALFEEGNENDELMLEHPKYYADILISGIIELVQQKEAADNEITEIILDLIERAGKD